MRFASYSRWAGALMAVAFGSGITLALVVGDLGRISSDSHERAIAAEAAGTTLSHRRMRQVHLLPSPTGLFIAGTRSDAVALKWRTVRSPIVGYRVYRATRLNGPYDLIGSVPDPYVNTYVDSNGLAPGVTYAYTVTAYDRQSESAPAGPVMGASTAPLVLAPTATVGPLPTFAPLPPATLTAVSGQPQVLTPMPIASPMSGTAPLPVSATPSPAATAIPVGTPSATPVPGGTPPATLVPAETPTTAPTPSPTSVATMPPPTPVPTRKIAFPTSTPLPRKRAQ